MIAVVGHGPSMMDSGLGKLIDSFEYVFRFLHIGDWQKSKDFGDKTSFYCASIARAHERMREQIPELGYFFWSKTVGKGISSPLKKLIKRHGGADMSKVIQRWQRRLPIHALQYLSHGTSGICIAADRIGEPITAFGCDSLKDGIDIDGDYIGSWLYENRTEMRGRLKKRRSHTLSEERKLVDAMADEYGVSIQFYGD